MQLEPAMTPSTPLLKSQPTVQVSADINANIPPKAGASKRPLHSEANRQFLNQFPFLLSSIRAFHSKSSTNVFSTYMTSVEELLQTIARFSCHLQKAQETVTSGL